MTRLLPEQGRIFHSNHYLSDELRGEERSIGDRLRNSEIRYRRIAELADPVSGPMSRERIAGIMRDRQDPENAISVEFDDRHEFGEYMTVCGVIAEPEAGLLWVSAGPPSQRPYAAFGFQGADLPDHIL
jgi:hypothetical protein